MPAPYDLAFKLLADDDPSALVRLITDLPAGSVLESYDRELNVETLRADHLFRVKTPARGDSLLHIESLTSYDSDWALGQLKKAMQISLKHWLPLQSVVLFLSPRRVPKRLPGELSAELDGLRVQLRVRIVRLWEVPARRALDAGSLAVCPWTVLMDSTADEQQEAAARIVASGDRNLAFRMALLGGLRYGNKIEILERLDG